MARSNRNVTSAKPGSCPMNKKLRNAVLDELITTHEQNPNKRRGDIARIVEASQEEYPYVTRDNFNNRWRALKKQRKEAAAATNSTENSAGSSEGSVLANAAEGDLNSAEKAGRKKGSTDAAKLERTQQEMEALHWVTMKCKESKDRNPKKMKSGTIDHLITSARSKFKLPPMWNPSKETIRTRLKKKIHVVNPKRGPKSPVPEAVERTVVEIACESNRCGRPLDTSEIIDLANDLIKGQPIEKDIIDWQIRFCPTIRKRFKETKERPTSANLGPGWYQGFRQRNPEIATAKAINHDERRAPWCKYGNMSDMYGMIYKRLKEAGHAKELPTPQWQVDTTSDLTSDQELPESQDTQYSNGSQVSTASAVTIPRMNTDGLAGFYLDHISQQRKRTVDQYEELRKRRKEQELQTEDEKILKYHTRKKISSGEMYKNGDCGPTEFIHRMVNRTERAKRKKDRDSTLRKHQSDTKAYQCGLNLLENSSKPMNKWTNEDIRVAIVSKIIGRSKEKYYRKMPNDRASRMELWQKVRCLPHPAEPYFDGFSDDSGFSDSESDVSRGSSADGDSGDSESEVVRGSSVDGGFSDSEDDVDRGSSDDDVVSDSCIRVTCSGVTW
ncbi:unnamed protein product [Cylindrotheca closterium]|uniref:Uncharacterized protein n=1 Tax=Cylindrotheca closterium TaxID=2856 RepID=A0AAD2FFN7_9STRA|nr:unnamed protein product [Cylindrotheca closterium]